MVNKKHRKYQLLMMAIIVLLILSIIVVTQASTTTVHINRFMIDLQKNIITKIYVHEGFTEYFTKSRDLFRVDLPLPLSMIFSLASRGITILVGESGFYTILSSVGKYILGALISSLSFYFLFSFFLRSFSGSVMDSFDTNFREYTPNDNDVITWKDVAGLSSKKKQIQECIDFLKDPRKFRENGAILPRGILLTGNPGNGKTLLARAIAGECGLPILVTSGTQFEEMYVGVGAKRVRALFARARTLAKEKKGCVIFIDEIDGLGSKRMKTTSAADGSLNQLLVEIDGFLPNENILVIGSTNREEALDPALLRSGRFDRKIRISSPNAEERKEILQLYMKNIPIDSSVAVEDIVRITTTWSGADLAHLVNEAAVASCSKNKPTVSNSDFTYSLNKIAIGEEGSTKIYSDSQKLAVAVHESGHALMGYLYMEQLQAKPYTITIVPRGDHGILGFVWEVQEKDLILRTKEYLEASIKVSLAGYMAEQVLFGIQKTSVGAASDFDHVYKCLRVLVRANLIDSATAMRPVAIKISKNIFGEEEEHLSEENLNKAEKLANVCLEKLLQETKTLIIQNKNKLLNLAYRLIEKEILGFEEMKDIFSAEEDLMMIEQTTPTKEKKESYEDPEVYFGSFMEKNSGLVQAEV